MKLYAPLRLHRICIPRWSFLCWWPWGAERRAHAALRCGCSLRSRNPALWRRQMNVEIDFGFCCKSRRWSVRKGGSRGWRVEGS